MQSFQCSEVISLLRNRVAKELLTEEFTTRLESLVANLPDVLSSYYLECRLTAQAQQVDFMGAVVATAGRERLLSHLRLRGDQLSPIWRSLAQFCTVWARPGSILNRAIPHVWLAFDILPGSSAQPAPCILISVDPVFASESQKEEPNNSARNAKLLELVTSVVAIFSDTAFSPLSQQCDCLQFCCESLPSVGRLVHFSIMTTRDPRACKLNLSLPATEMSAYLAGIGVYGLGSEPGTLVSQLCPANEAVKFQIVVNDKVAPSLELEFHYESNEASLASYRKRLDLLNNMGVCSAGKRDALVSWPGVFRLASARGGRTTQWTTWTDIKVVWSREGPLSAKAYLGMMPWTSIF